MEQAHDIRAEVGKESRQDMSSDVHLLYLILKMSVDTFYI